MAKRSAGSKTGKGKKAKPAKTHAHLRKLKPKTAKAPRRVAGARRSERHTGGGGASTGPGDGGSRPLRGTQPADLQVPSDFHALYDRGVRAARGVAPMAPRRDTRGHRRLAAAVEGLEVHYDEHTGSPNLVVSREPDAQLSRRSRGTPAEAVTQFLAKRGDLWGLTPEDADSIEVLSVSEPRGAARAAESPSPRRARRAAEDTTFTPSAMKTVNLIQRIGSKEVFNSDVTAAVGAANQVLAVSGQFFSGTGEQQVRSRARRAAGDGLTRTEVAIAQAVFDLTNVTYNADEFALIPSTADAGHYRFYEHRRGRNDTRSPLERPVRVKDVMFPLGEGKFVPGYYLELWIKGYPAFSYVMDAIDTPDVLYRKNLTSHAGFSYRVHNTQDALFRPHDGPAPGTPHPAGKPNGFQAKPVKEVLVQIQSLLAGDPWLPPAATTTDGNNCIAYADLTDTDAPGPGNVMGKVSAAGVFDYTYNHSRAASDPTNLQNSLVGMFFHVNWLHDRWYEAGFDEASGNAQKNNFGRGGAGGDPILAEGNDASGHDNANMTTPSDGESPRMQMFEFQGPSPKPSRTSNHEALITFHEMGHYITNRLVGNANGLTNTQGRAMGEGWGDFFAICMTSQSTDDFATGAFACGGWTDLTPSFNDNYYFSIRRYPYSADMAKNPLTFKHIGNNVVLPTGPPIQASPFGNNEFHNAGEMWCTALWEVFVNLFAKHGHADAEKRVLAYVIGGLKLTPIRPTFMQARDAILTAVTAMDPADLTTVRAGFAKRGMGTGAVAPPSNSSSLAGVVESFVP